ncbi:hypothetical protein [Nonomuraea sp. NPDC050783]|uniref:hypothetical protein n=1 Tax=Nonomuraea sp. NPDC050783 TaxID=3154634 RepID=UPI0034677483
MIWLRDVLDELADEAPRADLAERTIRIRERRRRRAVSLVAAAAVVAIALAATAAVRLLPGEPDAAGRPSGGEVSDLPARGVGPLSHAYLTYCRPERGAAPRGCVHGGWRVVTRGGRTYRLADALRSSPTGLRNSPLAISRDGRKVAYYKAAAGTFVVRDLATGAVKAAPTRVPRAWLGSFAHLLLSDDGRFLAFTKAPRLKDPAMLFDLRERMARPLPNGWNPIGLSPDGGTITLAEYAPKTRLQVMTHLWRTSTAGNGKAVDVSGHYLAGGLGPDGRSVAALEVASVPGTGCTRSGGDLVHLDLETGRTLRRVAIRGVSLTDHHAYLRSWVGTDEITLLTSPFRCRTDSGKQDGPAEEGERLDPPYVPFTAYALNVRTGETRRLATYTAQDSFYLVLPGFPGTL